MLFSTPGEAWGVINRGRENSEARQQKIINPYQRPPRRAFEAPSRAGECLKLAAACRAKAGNLTQRRLACEVNLRFMHRRCARPRGGSRASAGDHA